MKIPVNNLATKGLNGFKFVKAQFAAFLSSRSIISLIRNSTLWTKRTGFPTGVDCHSVNVGDDEVPYSCFISLIVIQNDRGLVRGVHRGRVRGVLTPLQLF